MRVLLDTNVLISYLLAPHGRGGPVLIVEAALAEEFVLLMPQEVLAELIDKATTSKRLMGKIAPMAVSEFVALLQEVGIRLPPLVLDPMGRYIRDPKDDYLIAYALAGQADYLVSLDKDLLVLESVETVQIVSTGQFLTILRNKATGQSL